MIASVKWNVTPENTFTRAVTFTPADTDAYIGFTTDVTFVVSKQVPAWKDGEIPVLTIEYGTEFSSERVYTDVLKDYLAVSSDALAFGIHKDQTSFGRVMLDIGEYNEYSLYVYPRSTLDTNWEKVWLPFVLRVAPGEANFSDVMYNTKTGVLSGKLSDALLGTVDITVGDKVFEDIALDRGNFEVNWIPEDTTQNVTVDVKIVYNAAEGDKAYVNTPYEGEITYVAVRHIEKLHKDIMVTNRYNRDWESEGQRLVAGEVVVINTRYDFVYWEITDKDGNSVIDKLERYDNTTPEDKLFRFIMPEYDLVINAVHQYQLDNQEKLDNCECLCHSDNEFVQFFWKIFVRIITILEQLFEQDILCECGFDHCAKTAF